MATLTLYGSDVSNGTLTTASSMSNTTGGTETSSATTETGTNNDFIEVFSQSASSVSFTSIQSPSGKGWVYSTGAGTFSSGNWSATITFSGTSLGTSNLTVRFYKYSGGVYTSIGTINKTGVVSAKTAYSFTATSMPSTTFGSSDLLYVDLWFNDTTGTFGDIPTVYISNSATAGVANDMVINTSTFTAGGVVVLPIRHHAFGRLQ